MTQPCPEIAALLHERRFTRYLVLQRDVPRIKGFCAWCGKAFRGRKYCSQECRQDAYIRASGSEVRCRVFQRDKSVCAACGTDCEWVKQQYRIMRNARRENQEALWQFAVALGPYRSTGYEFWQADHIIPVSEGGGVCGLDNYRTLCLRCHKLDTALLAKRLAERKRK